MTDLSLIIDAGAMVGPSSDANWQRLVREYGAEAVEMAVADLRDETRQPVNAAKAEQRLAQERADEQERQREEAEDAAAQDMPRTTGSQPSAVIDLTGADALHATEKPPALAIAAPASAPVAGIKLPLPSTATLIQRVLATTKPTPPAKESAMPKPATKPALPKDAATIADRVRSALAAQDLSQSDLAKQIGLSGWTVSTALRTSQFTAATAEKFTRWLNSEKPMVIGTVESADGEKISEITIVRKDEPPAEKPIAFPAAATPRQARLAKAPAPQLRLRTHYAAIERLDALGVAILHMSRENPREAGIIASIYADLAEDIAAEEAAAVSGKDGGK